MPQLNPRETIFKGWRRAWSLQPFQSTDSPEKKHKKQPAVMCQGHVGASHSQGTHFLPRRLATPSPQDAARVSPVHRCVGAKFPSSAVIARESSWALISLTVRGKLKHSARWPAFSLAGFPRAWSCNSQSLSCRQQQGSPWHWVEGRPPSLLRMDRDVQSWCSRVGDWLVSYLLCTCTSPKNHFQSTAQIGSWLKICDFDLQLGPLKENTG